MSLKKSDMAKKLARKLDGKMKSTAIPNRFAQGSADLAARRPQSKPDTEGKLVPVACRLPAELVNQLRERAVGHQGGVNAILAQALADWLDAKDDHRPPER